MKAPDIKAGGKYFYIEVSRGQVGALHVFDPETQSSRVLLDPQEDAPDGSVPIGLAAPSLDGSKLVYSGQAGSLWHRARILDVETGELLPDVLFGLTCGASVSWRAPECVYWSVFGVGVLGSDGKIGRTS